MFAHRAKFYAIRSRFKFSKFSPEYIGHSNYDPLERVEWLWDQIETLCALISTSSRCSFTWKLSMLVEQREPFSSHGRWRDFFFAMGVCDAMRVGIARTGSLRATSKWRSIEGQYPHNNLPTSGRAKSKQTPSTKYCVYGTPSQSICSSSIQLVQCNYYCFLCKTGVWFSGVGSHEEELWICSKDVNTWEKGL